MTEIESLNQYSRNAYDFLKSNYPTYLKNLSFLDCEDFGGNFMKFEIQPPNKKASYNLTFDTNENQITVCFDDYHCHYDDFANSDFNGEMKRSMETITKIISDELLVVSYYREGSLCMSGLKERDFLDNVDQQSIELKNGNFDMLTTISWTGEYDKQKTVNQKTTEYRPLPKTRRSWWRKLFDSK